MTKEERQNYINTALECLRKAGMVVALYADQNHIQVICDSLEVKGFDEETGALQILVDGLDISQHTNGIILTKRCRLSGPKAQPLLAPIVWKSTAKAK